MFADLDDTLRALLIREVPLDADQVDLTFEIPNREWSGRLTRPTINCFLYDIRENLKLRKVGWEVRRGPDANSASRQRNPIRVDVTYQVTAWARAREDEHRLLWRVLHALVRNSPLPEAVLQGGLAAQGLPVATSVMQPEQMPANVGDLWQGLDNPIHPSLTYVVTLVLDPGVSYTSPVVLAPPVLHTQQIGGAALAVTGAVHDAAGTPIAGALVLLQQTGARAFTDEAGRFSIAGAPRGRVTLVLRAAGKGELVTEVEVPGPEFLLEL